MTATITAPVIPQPIAANNVVGLVLQNTQTTSLAAREITFGQEFSAGQVPAGAQLVALINGVTVPVQMDVKTTNPDGSVQMAVLTLPQPALAANSSTNVMLELAPAGTASAPALSLASLNDANYSFSVDLNLHNANGTTTLYQIDAAQALQQALKAGTVSYWQQGPLATQARVDVAISGSLHVVLNITMYADGTTSTDVQFDNDLAMTASGGTAQYDATIVQSGTVALQQNNITQYQYQTWHQQVWSNGAPLVNVQHDVLALEKTGLIQAYDLSTGVNSSLVASEGSAMQGAGFGILGNAGLTTYMPTTGGRPDIGTTTLGNVLWLMTQNQTAANYALAQADAAGSVPWHLFDPTTGNYISVTTNPKLWAVPQGGPATGTAALTQSIPDFLSKTDPGSGWAVDAAHEPDLDYVAYLMTGNQYYLDQLNAEASYDILAATPSARLLGQGIVANNYTQIRTAAWSLREVVEAAAANPNGSAEKAYFTQIMNNNFQYLLQEATADTAKEGDVYGYLMWGQGNGYNGMTAPWQQDYFATTVVLAAQQGDAAAKQLLQWESNFLVGSFEAASNGFSPYDGAAYQLVTAVNGGATPLTTWAAVEAATAAAGYAGNGTWAALAYPAYRAEALATLAGTITVTESPAAMQAYGWLLSTSGVTAAWYQANPAWNIDPMLPDGNYLTSNNVLITKDTASAVIQGSNGDQLIYETGGGDVTIIGGSAINLLFAGTGTDTLLGGIGADYLFGGSGTDILSAGAGDNYVQAGTGPDTFMLAARDAATDLIVGFKPGIDTLSVTDLAGVQATPSDIAGLIAGATVDASGDAVLHLSSSHSVTLQGIGIRQLAASMFQGEVIRLGSADATVTLGFGGTLIGGGGNNVITVTAANETVNGGSGNNTIIVTAASIGAKINGGTGANTLEISGGGNVVMGSAVTGISRVELLQAAGLTLNTISDLRVFGTAAQVTGSTISNFQAGDTLDISNLVAATASLTGIVVGTTSTVLTVGDGTHTASLTMSGAFGAGSFRLGSDGSGGTDISFLPSVGYAYTLPTQGVTLTLGSQASTVTTTAADLVHGDSIVGGSGGNSTLALSGGGTFNLAIPVTLTGFSTISVREGAGTTLDLRAGLNATVNVTGSGGITIVGAANGDVINLGSGNDTVTLAAGETVNGGSGNNTTTITATNETVNGGSGNNTIIVTAASIGARINGGTGTSTLQISGGGNAVMGSAISGISRVALLQPTSLTLNSIPNLRVFGTAAQVTGSTLSNFQAGDTLDITNLAAATASLTGVAVGATSTVLTVGDGTHTAAVTFSGTVGAGSFRLGSDGSGGTDISFLPSVGYAYTLPTQAVTLTLGSQANTVTTTVADLLHGDSIVGGSGGNSTLALSGGGTFNLATPATLTGFSTITVREGAGTTLDLRAGLNATVNVTGSGGITIVGAANSDVINLGSGSDTVTLGVGETVNGGSGNDTFIVAPATIGATIHGGAGVSTLIVTGGGAPVMSSKISGISNVQLATKTTFTANATANMQIAGSTGDGDIITLGAASQSVMSGGVNELVVASAANAGARVSGLGAGSELEITSAGTVTLNSATGGSAGDPLIVKLSGTANLTLSPMQFIDAIGSNGYDTITAGAMHQTLTGGSGADTLIGYAGGHDIFQDTAVGIYGDTIRNFLSTDQIDLTNLVPGTAMLTATASGTNTEVTIVSGATRTNFVMTGSFTQSGFGISADGAGGTFITHG